MRVAADVLAEAVNEDNRAPASADGQSRRTSAKPSRV